LRARQFRRGAHNFADIESGEPNWPKYALLGHAAELALKAVPRYFEQSSTYQKPGAAPPANHDLVGQYEWAKLHGLASNELIEADLPVLSELHRDHYARYPKPIGQVWLPSEFDDFWSIKSSPTSRKSCASGEMNCQPLRAAFARTAVQRWRLSRGRSTAQER
jgi:hypothetical protein